MYQSIITADICEICDMTFNKEWNVPGIIGVVWIEASIYYYEFAVLFNDYRSFYLNGYIIVLVYIPIPNLIWLEAEGKHVKNQ